MLVDTGCVFTGLTPRAIDRLHLDRSSFTGGREVFTAGGVSMVVPTGRISSLRVGSTEVRDVEVAEIDLPRGVNLDGLLV